ncbi:hypothetical protein GCM10009678_81770 [Actinomadura kijaniata]|uniref:DUF308 domain-containing protein n=1 Tax=Actinomadura namibiensis TaxID=182080 RepID=A0A7W3QNC1_ACTNM|nr:hypothetical protein [Actinomadura namibiensis]MBA8953502.1 hypothetical protein [Actinomadura namibiensis]
MNRRGNGLSADAYAPLADLAPDLADAMLTALREAGIAAYALSEQDVDRLYVDVAMKPTAEGVLRAHLPRQGEPDPLEQTGDADDGADGAATGGQPTGPQPTGTLTTGPQSPVGGDAAGAGDGGRAGERDEDAIWAEIVAGYDAVHEGDRVPWPDEENIDEPAGRDEPREGEDRTGRFPDARVIRAAHDDEDDYPPAPDEEGHYVPPPPPPLPSADPLTKGAWIALVGGPLYLLLTVLLSWHVPGWAAFLAVAAFIGGFVTLVLRMGDEPRDGDDGAII